MNESDQDYVYICHQLFEIGASYKTFDNEIHAEVSHKEIIDNGLRSFYCGMVGEFAIFRV